MGKKKGRASAACSEELEHLGELPWSSSVPAGDPFSFFSGPGAALDGGFLSLEEIDEADYNLVIPDPGKQSEEGKTKASQKAKKQKKTDIVVARNEGVQTEAQGGVDEADDAKQRKKKKKRKRGKQGKVPSESPVGAETKEVDDEEPVEEDEADDAKQRKKKKKRKKGKHGKMPSESLVGAETKEDDEEEPVDEDEFNAWNELRLHPQIMKAIHKLGFKEPTPIQKACIPAAAHQGKDIIGAAETGSGKTLAFGLPILQRLLDEQEKVEKLMLDDGDDAEKVAPRRVLRALIITPTRELALQVTDHLRSASKFTNFRVVPIVGGMSTEKQERLLKARPEIVVGTPGRLWELMSGGEKHLVELHSLSFFVLDEADRMIETGHFPQLQSIVDMLPVPSGSTREQAQDAHNCITVSSIQRKKRQTFVFSATIALSSDFRKKLKRGSLKSKQSTSDGLSSIEALSERAGMRSDAAIVDLTNASIMASKLEESFIECREEDKDAYLYYILSVHGQGRVIVFCTSVYAVLRVSDLLRTLKVSVWTLHSRMQQRARLKATDRFRENEHGVLVATDIAARGLDIPGVRTVIHYQLPHSAEVYVHRSGRTARASSDGCSIALISANDRSKFASLCKAFAKDTLQRFPIEGSYMPEVMKRLSLALQIHKISRTASKEKDKNWARQQAESVGLIIEDSDSEEERVNKCKETKAVSMRLKKLKEELNVLLSRPLQPKSFSHRFLAGAGISPILQQQIEQLTQDKSSSDKNNGTNKRKLVVIGQDCVEPLQVLRQAGPEKLLDIKSLAEQQRNMENLRRKRREAKNARKNKRENKRESKRKQLMSRNQSTAPSPNTRT